MCECPVHCNTAPQESLSGKIIVLFHFPDDLHRCCLLTELNFSLCALTHKSQRAATDWKCAAKLGLCLSVLKTKLIFEEAGREGKHTIWYTVAFKSSSCMVILKLDSCNCSFSLKSDKMWLQFVIEGQSSLGVWQKRTNLWLRMPWNAPQLTIQIEALIYK